MRERLQRVIEERARTWEQAKALLDTAEGEKRELTAEEDQKWNAMNEDLSKFDRSIGQLQQALDGQKAADEAREKLEAVTRTDEPKPEERGDSDADKLRKLAAGEVRAVEFTMGAEARDLTKGSATAGGNTVPTSFVSRLYEHMIEVSAIRSANPTVIRTDGGEDIKLPKTTSFSTAAIVGEGAAISESDPAFGQLTLGAFKYGFLLQASHELVADTSADLVGFFARQGGRALGEASGEHFVTGDGSSKPNGIVTAATVGVTGGTGVTGAFTADNLFDLYFSVIAPYRRAATWMLSDAGMKVARKLKDAENQYLWAPGLTAGEPSVLLGRPVVVDTHVADPAVAAKSIVFGDISAYVIRDVNGVRIERSDDFAFANDLITWRFLFRTDGDLLDTTGAVKVFQGGAS